MDLAYFFFLFPIFCGTAWSIELKSHQEMISNPPFKIESPFTNQKKSDSRLGLLPVSRGAVHPKEKPSENDGP
jgi:hypothetical protein